MRDFDACYDFGALDIFVYEIDGEIFYKFCPAPWTGDAYDMQIGDELKRASQHYRQKQKDSTEKIDCPECGKWLYAEPDDMAICWLCETMVRNS